MYKALVRSHFDYCDILYHIPSLQTQLGVCLTDLMEKAERIQYQAALAITVHGKVQVVPNSMRN